MAAAAIVVALAAPAAASAAFQGANGRIYFTARAPDSPTTDIWSVNADGSGLLDLTDTATGPGEGHDPSVAPTGLVAFTVGTGGAAEIWAMGADGTSPRRLTDDAFADRMPAVSPDGTRIAFVSDRGADPDLWTMAADGSDLRPLLSGPGDDLSPQYSADGAHVVLATNASGNFDVAYVPVAGSPHASATSITFRSSIEQTTPAIQPDMVRLAYTQTDPAIPGPSDIFTAYSDDGTDEFPLAVDPAARERQPAFSPDSTEVVYVTDAGLVVAAAGGGSPRPLATAPATAPADPDWAVGPPLDRTPPQTRITSEPRRRIERRRARFRFRSGEAGARFECRFDRLAFEDCSSPVTYRQLKRRRHRFRVRAIDAAGNVDPSPAKARFRVVQSGHRKSRSGGRMYRV